MIPAPAAREQHLISLNPPGFLARTVSSEKRDLAEEAVQKAMEIAVNSSESPALEVVALQTRVLKLRWLGSEEEADRLAAELKQIVPTSTLVDIADTD